MMSVMRMIRLITVFLLATLSLVAVPCLAQTERGSITGVVTDSSKGAIPGVSVKVINTGTNVAVNLVTSASGDYSAPNLSPGTYRVEASIQAAIDTLRGRGADEPGEALARAGDGDVVGGGLGPSGTPGVERARERVEGTTRRQPDAGGVDVDVLRLELPARDGEAERAAHARPSRLRSSSFSTRRRILPDAVLGMASTSATSCSIL